MDEFVVLVNEQDEEIGTMEKLTAHQIGALHRAFSIFILDHENNLILQKRAFNKYHSGGLWTNTCCSHQMPGEEALSAAQRRLQEEMGFSCHLELLFHFRYQASVGNELIENEYDHVFWGRYEGPIQLNNAEVADYKIVDLASLKSWINARPQDFTAWFLLVMPTFLNTLQSKGIQS
ncbi:MAG: isopentenyl-diphosphate Delta-isomerase [Bacteroidetes bacterium]|nr:isopentenyl-diphosphate Delta-isomerase [Bacteroidota bacterium]MBS1738958.1 isopentenyl-diphosphate Delta-isomerase [Bacteroidota bacterium]MBS1775457.1 isopentenyl-diphosphate Delta-isomerase [Bacteroidota bacterium]